MLHVCLPGTGGMMPLPERYLAACVATHEGRSILIDCGEATQVALRRAEVKTSALVCVLLTHYHADHVSGLPGLLLTLGNQSRTEPLLIAGPPGLARVVEALCVLAPALPYPVRLLTLEDGDEFESPVPGLSVRARALSHRVPCLGYRLTLRRKPVFDPDAARALGVPVRSFGPLHEGRAVTLPDGRVVEPDAVIRGARPPIVLCYATDTRPTEAVAALARGADLAVLEGMYGDPDMDEKMREKKHMLFGDAARLAGEAGARRLWLTHFSPALKSPESALPFAQAVFPGACAGFDGIETELAGESVKFLENP